MSDDLTRFLTVLLWAALIWAALAIAVGAARAVIDRARATVHDDEIEAWLRARGEQVYDWKEQGL